MKRLITLTVLVAAVSFLGSWRNTASAQPGGVGVAITYQDFYDGLSPYGEWIDYPEYGYVWRPTMVSDFQPYSSGGRWVWSDDYEWMWVSDYDWGWAPFHYGRWFQDPVYGWMWVPGYEWGPAWVAWRDGGDYYGWAPLRPGIHLSVNFNIGLYNPPIDYWCFAPRRYITSNRIWNYCLPRRQNVTIINNTTIINNYGRYGGRTFAAGPRRMDVERYAGRINPVRFRDMDRPGRTQIRRNEVSIYRPDIRRDNNRQIAPRQFNRYDGNNTVRNERSDRGNRDFSNRNDNNGRDNRNGNTIRRNNDRRTGNPAQTNTDRGTRQPNIENRVRNDRRVTDNRVERRETNGRITDRNVVPERNTRINRPTPETRNNPREDRRSQRRPDQDIQRNQRVERSNPAPQRMERSPRPERTQSPQRMERSPRPERTQSPQRVERSPRPERTPAPQRMERSPRPERTPAPQRMERSPRPERTQSPQRSERRAGRNG